MVKPNTYAIVDLERRPLTLASHKLHTFPHHTRSAMQPMTILFDCPAIDADSITVALNMHSDNVTRKMTAREHNHQSTHISKP